MKKGAILEASKAQKIKWGEAESTKLDLRKLRKKETGKREWADGELKKENGKKLPNFHNKNQIGRLNPYLNWTS